MGRKNPRKQSHSDDMTSRNWDQWRDPDDHTGDRLVSGAYETPQDYLGSSEYQENEPLMRANRVEQALIFLLKLVESHHLAVRSSGILGEKLLVVIESRDAATQKLKSRLLKEFRQAGYGSVPVEIRFE